jgi:hypothetical protein
MRSPRKKLLISSFESFGNDKGRKRMKCSLGSALGVLDRRIDEVTEVELGWRI